MTQSTVRTSLVTLMCGAMLIMLTACASTKTTDRRRQVTEPLPRPGQILVYDFAATPSDVPSDSTLAQHFSIAPSQQSTEEIARGRALGAQMARELAAEIRAMGMPATHVVGNAKPRIDDIVIRGYFVAINEGDAVKRVAIGFGSGSSEVRTAVEGLQMTQSGLRQLGYGAVQSGGGKSPGAAAGAATFAATANPVGLIVSTSTSLVGEATGRSTAEGRVSAMVDEIAKTLKQRFKEEGWI